MIFHRCLLLVCALSLLPTLSWAKAPSWHSSLSFPEEMTITAPAGITIDFSRQRYYVIDYTGNQLVSFDEKGQLLDRFDASGTLNKPVSLAFASPGKIWIAQRSSNELLYVDLNDRDVRRFDLSKTTSQPVLIDRVVTDDKNRLYVANSHDGRIIRLDDNLKISAVFSPQPDGALIDFKIKGTSLYALDGRHRQILRFTLDGQQLEKITLDAPLDRAVSFDIDSHGTIYVLDRPAGKIVVFSAKGLFQYDFCRRGARRGQLNYPVELHFDWRQQLCVVNQGNDRIEVFKH
jgi:DNA-binding beta-propeller fold protein YncE